MVEFVLVGGVAATVHGSARLTRHVDVVYARTPANIQRLVGALAPHASFFVGLSTTVTADNRPLRLMRRAAARRARGSKGVPPTRTLEDAPALVTRIR